MPTKASCPQRAVAVYNLQIEGEHEYFANNVLVHNCDSWALAEYLYVTLRGVPKSQRPPEERSNFDASVRRLLSTKTHHGTGTGIESMD